MGKLMMIKMMKMEHLVHPKTEKIMAISMMKKMMMALIIMMDKKINMEEITVKNLWKN